MKKTRKYGILRSIWPLLALSGSLAGCCGSIDCDCDVSSASDVVVSFDQDSLQSGFRAAEIRGAYAVRYVRPGFLMPLDTARQVLAATNFNSTNYISLQTLRWPANPAPPATGEAFTKYNYRLVLPNASRSYSISELEVATEAGSGCCGCPFNTRRRFVLNGKLVIAEGGASYTVLRR
ncbi:hypothetical protein BEN47_05645 [Hymenobacter lapidarius]|uniref:Lipoprotein n=1 Tax=Hymenobacter lapidarius TaxID=1908237 RepID=A0A1G1SS32_9BACT|nr:hypothetical protein [Hymenobacter lapidarius]OGX81431.1 hypothetical protein BEN47_05645 [Hymenobacter lapidarius]